MDWQPHDGDIADGVAALHWGQPQFSNHSRDLRCRPGAVIWRDVPESTRKILAKKEACVYRWFFDCGGACRLVPPDEQEKDWDGRNEEIEDELGANGKSRPQQMLRFGLV